MDQLRPTPTRLAEIVGGLTLACDVASGFPAGKVLRTVVISTRVGRRLGLGESQLRDTFYTNLFRFLGCTGFSHEEATEYGAGDDIVLRNVMAMADPSDPVPTLSSIVRRIGAAAPLVARGAAVARLLGDGKSVKRHAEAQCDASIALARMAGMSEPLLRGLGAICERWDGRGHPAHLSGDELSIAMRLHHLADGAEIAFHRDGPEAACALVKRRSGKWLDPAVAAAFVRHHNEILDGLDGPDLWDLYLAEEPSAPAPCAPEQSGDIAKAFGHLADLKSAYTLGHSSRVARLATGAANQLGLAKTEIEGLSRAGLLHDLGRLSVPNTVWDRPSKLSFADWERVRLHTYYTERILASSPAWRALAELAGGAHEQPGGKGYHRGLRQPGLALSSRILGAADAVAAMGEPRAYRAALTQRAIESELAKDVRDGRLDKRAVDAVLAVGKGARPALPREKARHLSDREAQVLRLVARGKTNKEIGSLLGISARTVQVHVAHVYDKLGVYSRAGAAIFAVESRLLDEDGG